MIELLQNRTVFFAEMSNILENTNGCAEKYCCATVLYLLSMLAHKYNIMIDSDVGAPGHGREVVDGLNATNFFLSMSTTTVQLPVALAYESQTAMHTSTANTDISLAREF